MPVAIAPALAHSRVTNDSKVAFATFPLKNASLMIPLRATTLCRIIPAIAITSLSTSVLACASCGCTLSSDWESQGFTTRPGLKMDIRYDYLNQDQLRHGTGRISAANASQSVTSTGDPQEVETYTRNNYLTLGLDYTINADWGINLKIAVDNEQRRDSSGRLQV